MGSAGIVVGDDRWPRGGALGAVLPDAAIGAFAQASLDEALGLAVSGR